MATAGQDVGDYKAWMEAANIDTSLLKVIDGKFCASFFCSTDQSSKVKAAVKAVTSDRRPRRDRRDRSRRGRRNR